MIKIANRYRPFSHRPGVRLLLPHTRIPVISTPTRLEIGEKGIEFPRTGPVEGFTTELDLERGRIRVWGHAREGYFEHTLEGKGEEWALDEKKGWVRPPLERLSLGCHKKQDWDAVVQRGDLAEILPFWFALGQQVEGGDLEVPSLRELFLACFDDLLFPLPSDPHHQGILVGKTFDPFAVLHGGAQAIRRLFLRDEGEISLLPDLPKEFHAGRMLGLRTSAGLLNLEWSKKTLKKVELIPDKEKIELHLPNGLKTFRVNRGERSGGTFTCVPGEGLQLDCFG